MILPIGRRAKSNHNLYEFLALQPPHLVYKVRMKHSPEALRSATLFDSGCGHLVVSRFKGDGRVEAGFFLLDVFCLGVKDAGFQQF